MKKPPWFHGEIERISHTHFFIKPYLCNCLKNQIITDDGRKFLGHNYQNTYEEWTGTFADKFFDMGTLIRLATAVEQNLKGYYMMKKGHVNRAVLHGDPKYKQNIFQRIMPWQSDGALRLYRDELSFDLSSISQIGSMQELMLHRHLYAHNSGLIDHDYIDRLKKLTGVDLWQQPQVAQVYPNDDVYWFEPLKRLNHFIEEAKRFFRSFP